MSGTSEIKTRPQTKEYRNNFDKIFRSNKAKSQKKAK